MEGLPSLAFPSSATATAGGGPIGFAPVNNVGGMNFQDIILAVAIGVASGVVTGLILRVWR